MRYEDPYQEEMAQAMGELLKMLKSSKLPPKTRLKAAETMDDISFHALQAETIRDVATEHGGKVERLTDQVKKLNKNNRDEEE